MRASVVWLICFYLSTGGCSGDSSSQSTGISGSTSRFAIHKNNLLILDGDKLDVFSLEDPLQPLETATITLDRDSPETIFATEGHFFIAASDGLSVFSIDDVGAVNKVSEVNHFTARDPVFVVGNYAYVTLRSPNEFGINQFQIYDFTDITQGILLNSYEMTFPWGLAVTATTAFVCDGSNGLQALNVSAPDNIQPLYNLIDDTCFDVLLGGAGLISTGSNGINQYVINANGSLSLVSEILVEPAVKE
ncbi:MAG: hypothetical protein HRU19_30415 [Pseudobacteriovorax sp.]|nr:hypothetical protein [Pseudobacteriovorax sp.]